MSQHADITKVVVARAIKSDWTPAETHGHYLAVLDALEYDDYMSHTSHIIDMANYMLTQKDGLYGVSHVQITDWLLANVSGLMKIDNKNY